MASKPSKRKLVGIYELLCAPSVMIAFALLKTLAKSLHQQAHEQRPHPPHPDPSERLEALPRLKCQIFWSPILSFEFVVVPPTYVV